MSALTDFRKPQKKKLLCVKVSCSVKHQLMFHRWLRPANHTILLTERAAAIMSSKWAFCIWWQRSYSPVCAGVRVDWSVFSQTFGDLLSKELESHAVHGTEEAVNAGPLSWLVMEGSSESSLEANVASVRQEQTDCLEGDATIWKRFSLGLSFISEPTLWRWPLE